VSGTIRGINAQINVKYMFGCGINTHLGVILGRNVVTAPKSILLYLSAWSISVWKEKG
jgi:hypothetical protein